MIRVLVVAEVRVFREGIVRFLENQPGVSVVGAAEPAQAATVLAATDPEIVLVNIPNREDLRAVRSLRGRAPGIKVVVVGVTELEDDLVAFAQAGVAGYVSRDGSLDDLLTAIEAAARGEFACSPSVAAKLLRLAGRHPQDRSDAYPEQLLEVLTHREVEIVGLIAEDLSNKQIATALHVALSTVKNHVHNVMQKLHTSRRSEIAALAQEAGFSRQGASVRSLRIAP